MELESRLKCTDCKGTGKVGRSTKITQGTDMIYSDGAFRAVIEQVICNSCNGTGYQSKPRNTPQDQRYTA